MDVFSDHNSDKPKSYKSLKTLRHRVALLSYPNLQANYKVVRLR
jgi:hypothetical protein